MSGDNESVPLRAVECRVAAEHNWVPREVVADVVRRAYASFSRSKVREVVPLLVERRARSEIVARFPPSSASDRSALGDRSV